MGSSNMHGASGSSKDQDGNKYKHKNLLLVMELIDMIYLLIRMIEDMKLNVEREEEEESCKILSFNKNNNF